MLENYGEETIHLCGALSEFLTHRICEHITWWLCEATKLGVVGYAAIMTVTIGENKVWIEETQNLSPNLNQYVQATDKLHKGRRQLLGNRSPRTLYHF